MKDRAEKLKPCPFCGGEAIDKNIDDGGFMSSFKFYCKSCHISFNICRARDEQQAISAWNKRVKEVKDE